MWPTTGFTNTKPDKRMQLTFYKYQGTGNDFVMIDDRSLSFPVHDTSLVKRLCDRRFGIGADGLILLQPHDTEAYFMKYYNSDGRESTMCGNGGRCLAAFAKRIGAVEEAHSFMAVDGPHEVSYEGTSGASEEVKLKMKDVHEVEIREGEVFVLNTGSPHYVRFLEEPLMGFDVTGHAKQVRYGDEFRAEGINVNFINLLGLKHISIRTYERGVEDETLSCGTGVTAAAVSTALLNGLPQGAHLVEVDTSGGRLKVHLTREAGSQGFSGIWLQGPATFVYQGEISA